VYRFLADALVKWAKKKQVKEITLETAQRVVRQVDEKIVSAFTPLTWTQSLDAVFQLAGDRIDPDLLAMYFADRGRPKIARMLARRNAPISRTELVELLSLPLFDELEVEETATIRKSRFEIVVEKPAPSRLITPDAFVAEAASQEKLTESRPVDSPQQQTHDEVNSGKEELPVAETPVENNIQEAPSHIIPAADSNEMVTEIQPLAAENSGESNLKEEVQENGTFEIIHAEAPEETIIIPLEEAEQAPSMNLQIDETVSATVASAEESLNFVEETQEPAEAPVTLPAHDVIEPVDAAIQTPKSVECSAVESENVALDIGLDQPLNTSKPDSGIETEEVPLEAVSNATVPSVPKVDAAKPDVIVADTEAEKPTIERVDRPFPISAERPRTSPELPLISRFFKGADENPSAPEIEKPVESAPKTVEKSLVDRFRNEPESRRTIMPPPPPKPTADVPLWKKFKPVEDKAPLNAASPDPKVALEARKLERLLGDKKEYFLFEIFAGDEELWKESMRALAAFTEWSQAGRYIVQHIFRLNKVDTYSDVGIDFIDQIQRYFEERRQESR
jgi:hypothetical protein